MLSPRIQKLEKELDDNLMDKIISVMYIKLYLDYDLGIDFILSSSRMQMDA